MIPDSYYWPKVYRTSEGVPYLKEPGCALITKPHTDLEGIAGFLEGFDTELEFDNYILDPHELDGGTKIAKFAGQLCYMSLGPDRTRNIDAQKYMNNIKSSKHGSIFEHANYSFLCWGIDRSVTHEIVRHRAGCAYSQVSQRYVDGKVLRFVERPEFQKIPELHAAFEARINEAAKGYDLIAASLTNNNREQLQKLSRRDARKAVNQAARAALPNEVEAPIVITMNGRAWRHFTEMRASLHADRPICELGYRVNSVLQMASPPLFGDYVQVTEEDGRKWFDTQHRKV